MPCQQNTTEDNRVCATLTTSVWHLLSPLSILRLLEGDSIIIDFEVVLTYAPIVD